MVSYKDFELSTRNEVNIILKYNNHTNTLIICEIGADINLTLPKYLFENSDYANRSTINKLVVRSGDQK